MKTAASTALFFPVAPKGRTPSDRLRRWYARHRQRIALAELDQRLLADIGVSHQDAARETAKPFWR